MMERKLRLRILSKMMTGASTKLTLPLRLPGHSFLKPKHAIQFQDSFPYPRLALAVHQAGKTLLPLMAVVTRETPFTLLLMES
jgi:hypothetical protein